MKGIKGVSCSRPQSTVPQPSTCARLHYHLPSTSMKLIRVIGFSVLSATALGSIIPRASNTIQDDLQNAANLCVSLKSTIDQIKPPVNGNTLLVCQHLFIVLPCLRLIHSFIQGLVTGANRLSAAFRTTANDAQVSTTSTDSQALAYIQLINSSMDTCVIPALNELAADASLLSPYKAEIEAELQSLHASYATCVTNLLAITPAAEKAQASQAAAKPNNALANCMKAYA
ncbi:hypothetical protein F5880DRAFT_816762 [Lentinula raphanica]|nr:hypothetical protein F5880DRAFT_816762 [Lentinula raphanica]